VLYGGGVTSAIYSEMSPIRPHCRSPRALFNDVLTARFQYTSLAADKVTTTSHNLIEYLRAAVFTTANIAKRWRLRLLRHECRDVLDPSFYHAVRPDGAALLSLFSNQLEIGDYVFGDPGSSTKLVLNITRWHKSRR